MNNLIKIFQRIYSFCIYNIFLYTNFLLLFAFVSNINLELTIIIAMKLLPAYLLIGIGGYFLNDLFDQKADRLAKKFNVTSLLNKNLLTLIIIGLWFIGFYFVYTLSVKASLFLIMQFIALLLYSATPFRFKERGVLGVITDALYAHVIPELILLSIIREYTEIPYWLWAMFLLFTFSIGIRDILIHQVQDFKNDSRSNTSTYVLNNVSRSKGYVYACNIIGISSISLFFFFTLIFNFTVPFLILFILISVSYSVMVVKNKTLVNDELIRIYIISSSIVFAYLLIDNTFYYGFMFLIHPYFISFIRQTFPIIRKLISYIFVNIIPLAVNYSLYYLFLIVGRNLKNKPLYKKREKNILSDLFKL